MSADNLEFLNSKVSDEKIEALEAAVSVQLRIEELKSKAQDRELRKKFAEDVFTVIVIYIAVVMFILIAYGLSRLHFSDAVLITLLSTTTANVLSLLAIVFNYLFPKKTKY